MAHESVGTRDSPILVSSSEDEEVVYLGEHRRKPEDIPSSSKDIPKHTGSKAYNMMLNMGYIPGQGLGRELEGEVEPLGVVLKRKRTNSGVGCRSSASPIAGPSSDVMSAQPANEEVTENKAKRPKRRHRQRDRSTQLQEGSQSKGTVEVRGWSVAQGEQSSMHKLPSKPYVSSDQGGTTYPTPLCPFNCPDPLCSCKGFTAPLYPDHNQFFPDAFPGPQMPLPPWLTGPALVPLAATLMQQGLPLPPEMAVFASQAMPYGVVNQGMQYGHVLTATGASGAGPSVQSPSDHLPNKEYASDSINFPFDAPTVPLPASMVSSPPVTAFQNHSSHTALPMHHKPIIPIGMPPDPDPESEHGLYPISPPPPDDPNAQGFKMPIPSCTLVMESMPWTCRHLSFVRKWAESFGASNVVRVELTGGKGKKKKGAKALIEFSSVETARRAWSSPRLAGDGKDQICVWWYRVPGVGASAGVGELEEGEIGGEEEPAPGSDSTHDQRDVADLQTAQQPKQKKMRGKRAGQKAREKELAELMIKATAEKRRLAQVQKQGYSVLLAPQPDSESVSGTDPTSSRLGPARPTMSCRSQSSEEVAKLLDEPEPMDIDSEYSRSPSLVSKLPISHLAKEEDHESIASSRHASPRPNAVMIEDDLGDSHGGIKVKSELLSQELQLRASAPAFVPRYQYKTLKRPISGRSAAPGGESVAPVERLSPTSQIQVPPVSTVFDMPTAAHAPSHIGSDFSPRHISPSVLGSLAPGESKATSIPSEPRAMANAPKGPRHSQQSQLARRKDSLSPGAPILAAAGLMSEKKTADTPTAGSLDSRETLATGHAEGDLSKEEALRRLVLASRKAKARTSAAAAGSAPHKGKVEEPSMLSDAVLDTPVDSEARKVATSQSNLDDLAISFITETLQTVRTPSTDGSATVVDSPRDLPPHSDIIPFPGSGSMATKSDSSSHEKLALLERQNRLEEHLAATKALMAKLETAVNKQEKDTIMRLIRERNRLYEEGLKNTIPTSTSGKRPTDSTRSSVRFPSIRWPESARDAGILVISDDEDGGDYE